MTQSALCLSCKFNVNNSCEKNETAFPYRFHCYEFASNDEAVQSVLALPAPEDKERKPKITIIMSEVNPEKAIKYSSFWE